MKWLNLFSLLFKLIIPALAGLWARGETRKTEIKKERDDAKEKLKAWQNRPNSDDALSKRLRDKAAKLRKP